MHVLLEVVHRGLQPLSLRLLEREHHLPGAGAPLRLLHLLAKLVLLRFPSLSHDVNLRSKLVCVRTRWQVSLEWVALIWPTAFDEKLQYAPGGWRGVFRCFLSPREAPPPPPRSAVGAPLRTRLPAGLTPVATLRRRNSQTSRFVNGLRVLLFLTYSLCAWHSSSTPHIF